MAVFVIWVLLEEARHFYYSILLVFKNYLTRNIRNLEKTSIKITGDKMSVVFNSVFLKDNLLPKYMCRVEMKGHIR